MTEVNPENKKRKFDKVEPNTADEDYNSDDFAWYDDTVEDENGNVTLKPLTSEEIHQIHRRNGYDVLGLKYTIEDLRKKSTEEYRKRDKPEMLVWAQRLEQDLKQCQAYWTHGQISPLIRGLVQSFEFDGPTPKEEGLPHADYIEWTHQCIRSIFQLEAGVRVKDDTDLGQRVYESKKKLYKQLQSQAIQLVNTYAEEQYLNAQADVCGFEVLQLIVDNMAWPALDIKKLKPLKNDWPWPTLTELNAKKTT